MVPYDISVFVERSVTKWITAGMVNGFLSFNRFVGAQGEDHGHSICEDCRFLKQVPYNCKRMSRSNQLPILGLHPVQELRTGRSLPQPARQAV